MKRAISSFLLMGLVAGAGLGASAPGEKKTQFSLGGTFLLLKPDYESGSYSLVGAAGRVDFNLGRSFIVAPELSLGIGGWSAGGTINYRAGTFFAGAGGLVVGGFEEEWGTNSFLKLHIGIKKAHGLFAAAFIVNRWIKGFGLTAGYIF